MYTIYKLCRSSDKIPFVTVKRRKQFHRKMQDEYVRDAYTGIHHLERRIHTTHDIEAVYTVQSNVQWCFRRRFKYDLPLTFLQFTLTLVSALECICCVISNVLVNTRKYAAIKYQRQFYFRSIVPIRLRGCRLTICFPSPTHARHTKFTFQQNQPCSAVTFNIRVNSAIIKL